VSRPARWQTKPIQDGVMEVALNSWKYFHDYVHQEMLEFSHYIWRGQRDSVWELKSSLDRLLHYVARPEWPTKEKRHLEQFKLAVRGRRGPNPARMDSEDDWWALAQHNGMATPLLDWTESPFVALYFAFERPQSPASGLRAVWAVGGFSGKNKAIEDAHTGPGPAPTLRTVRPQQDENQRLVNQAGVFTRVPTGMTVESWIRAQYAGENRGALIKLTIPTKGRADCLRTLNRMNINHLSLFPDVFGAGEHCNKKLQIDRY